jgi:hypothetical protein
MSQKGSAAPKTYKFLFNEGLPTERPETVSATNDFEASFMARDKFLKDSGEYPKTSRIQRPEEVVTPIRKRAPRVPKIPRPEEVTITKADLIPQLPSAEATQKEKCARWAANTASLAENIKALADKAALEPYEEAEVAKLINFIKFGVERVERDCTPIAKKP